MNSITSKSHVLIFAMNSKINYQMTNMQWTVRTAKLATTRTEIAISRVFQYRMDIN